jgi:hypothetical protein
MNAAEPQKHSFEQFPENRATETSTFPDGTKLEIETKGCKGPATTTLSFVFTDAAKPAAGAKSISALARFAVKNQDALAKTPLGMPGPARALQQINEGKMTYAQGDKICFDKDDPQVIPSMTSCKRSMTISWSQAGKNVAVAYIAE